MTPRVPYTKPFLTFDEQLEHLESKGMEVRNREQAVACLQRYGYYRLSGYWHVLKQIDENDHDGERRLEVFRDHVCFEDAVKLCEFDRKLRLLILDGIERLEVAIRVLIAYQLGRVDKFAHTNASMLEDTFTRPAPSKQPSKKGGDPKPRPNDSTKFDRWTGLAMRNYHQSREKFVFHFATKYLLPMPIWISIETWDFGMLSHFYQGMKRADKRKIAKKMGLDDPELVESALRNMNLIRNISAHHSRLWNKNIADQVAKPKFKDVGPMAHMLLDDDTWVHCTSRLYASLVLMVHFIETLGLDGDWKSVLVEHLWDFPQMHGLGLNHMGFPENWESQHVWLL